MKINYEKKLRLLAEKLGVRYDEGGGDVALIGDDNHRWFATDTHDLFAEIQCFGSRHYALEALWGDASLGRYVYATSPHKFP